MTSHNSVFNHLRKSATSADKNLFTILLAAAFFFPSASSAHAQGAVDRVKKQNGLDSGRIIATSPLGVTINKGGVDSNIPAEEIVSIAYAGEPTELQAARNALQAGRPQETLDQLAKIAPDPQRREEIAADIEFYNVTADAQLALAGQGAPDAVAGDVRTFIAQRGKSFHVPEAIALVGDLLSAAGQHAAARMEYAKLAKARTPYYEIKSALLVGRSWQAEGDHAQALAEFDKALASPAEGPLVDPMKLAATLERAVSQAATGKVAESADAIGKVIAAAKPDDAELLARAYTALGDSYLASGDKRGALFAFLHVDLLFNTQREAHAKALHELVDLWKATGRADRAQEAAAQLKEKYPHSRWAKLENGGGF